MPTVSQFKLIQSLKDKKRREEHGLFVAEGTKVVQELLQSTAFPIQKLYFTSETGLEQELAKVPAGLLESVSEKDMNRMSLMQTPGSVLALVNQPSYSFTAFPDNQWSLLMDGIQDPGNLGTIIRLADWFGINSIFATTDTADCFGPKVVQASMGSLFRVKVIYGSCNLWLQEAKVPIYGTAMQGKSIWQHQHVPPGVLVIGNEGKGIREEVGTHICSVFSIPRLGQAESLNAGVATGIILSHLMATK
jgi:RNA methyltransferase, TrmH family